MGLLIHNIGDLDTPHPPPCPGQGTVMDGCGTVLTHGAPVRTIAQGINSFHEYNGEPCPKHSMTIAFGSATVFAEGANVGRVTDTLVPPCTTALLCRKNTTVFAGG